jgi:hypothetical protein
MEMNTILRKLEGGDRRSIGKADEVVEEVLSTPSIFHDVMEGLTVKDPVIRMRSADVVEKVSAKHPEILKPFKKKILTIAEESHQQEVRWHVARIIPRLMLSPQERCNVVEILFRYLSDKSKIVKTFAMQALADLSLGDVELQHRVIGIIEDMVETESPAVQSRGRKLLKKLK